MAGRARVFVLEKAGRVHAIMGMHTRESCARPLLDTQKIRSSRPPAAMQVHGRHRKAGSSRCFVCSGRRTARAFVLLLASGPGCYHCVQERDLISCHVLVVPS